VGQGAVQVRFVTRSGTNTFTGSGYWYARRDRFNDNTWFNIRNNVAKPKLKQDQIGARVGGPIMIPGLFDGRNKAFFFVNWEDPAVDDTLATEPAERVPAGHLQLCDGVGAAGQPVARSPRTDRHGGSDHGWRLADTERRHRGSLMTSIEPAALQLNVRRRCRASDVPRRFNFGANHRFSTAINHGSSRLSDTLNTREASSGFDRAGQTSKRMSVSNTLRSTLRSNLVNEVRVGYSGSPVEFYSELNKEMWSASPANQGGFQLTLGTIGSGLTNASAAPNPQARNAYSWLIEDNVNWLLGKHASTWACRDPAYVSWFETMVPTDLGLVTGDPP
jgi:hypothetical protein